MCQIFALEVDLRSAKFFTQALGIGHRSWAACVGFLQMSDFLLKGRVSHCRLVSRFEFIQSGDNRFWHKTPTKIAIVATFIGDICTVRFNVGHNKSSRYSIERLLSPSKQRGA